MPEKQPGGKGRQEDTLQACKRGWQSDFTRGRGPPLSRPPTGGEERTRSPWEGASLQAKAGAEDEESYGPNRQTGLGMEPLLYIVTGGPVYIV